MILTEEDARKRWCPFARVALPGHPSVNRISTATAEIVARGSESDKQWHAQAEGDTHCIASRCMAWREEDDQGDFAEVPARGYCGLVGKP